jgi:PKHD-type hydroxylase
MHIFPNPLPTNYNENYFSDSHYIWKNCGDDKIIEKFINLGESLSVMKALVGGGEVHEPTRISTLSWINYNEESKELFDFLVDKVDRINYYHYGMKLYGMESIQYSRYPIGGHYKFHNDVIARKEDSMRKLSIVMSLTDKDDYEGGDLLLMPHGDNPTSIRLDKGDLIAFPSFIPHKVTPVTSGNRITIVSWVIGPKFV